MNKLLFTKSKVKQNSCNQQQSVQQTGVVQDFINIKIHLASSNNFIANIKESIPQGKLAIAIGGSTNSGFSILLNQDQKNPNQNSHYQPDSSSRIEDCKNISIHNFLSSLANTQEKYKNARKRGKTQKLTRKYTENCQRISALLLFGYSNNQKPRNKQKNESSNNQNGISFSKHVNSLPFYKKKINKNNNNTAENNCHKIGVGKIHLNHDLNPRTKYNDISRNQYAKRTPAIKNANFSNKDAWLKNGPITPPVNQAEAIVLKKSDNASDSLVENSRINSNLAQGEVRINYFQEKRRKPQKLTQNNPGTTLGTGQSANILVNHFQGRALKENGPNTLLVQVPMLHRDAEIVCRNIFLATVGVVAHFLVHFLGEQKMNINR